MGCASCGGGDKPGGCKSNGGCSSGGCNRLNTYDWLAKQEFYDPAAFELVEVSFKSGARKEFFKNPPQNRCVSGDMVAVESSNGYDIGQISLSGELVRLQMKKKRVTEGSVKFAVIRRANERDLERMKEARSAEKPAMVKARAIARSLGLEMKIGDVEFQGDRRKATFYYTADGRVDFRELIRHYARAFKVKIEMRQIGARQESARIGGIGSCGRELCCSTWLSDFKSVSTTAARYQNLAINQTKLSGQCGRLKCCLNYELDTYMDALEAFPVGVDTLQTQAGKAVLVKTDIFKKLMFFAYEKDGGKGRLYPLQLESVEEIKAQNTKGDRPISLETMVIGETEEVEITSYGQVTGVVELPPEKRRKKKRNQARGSGQNRNRKNNQKSAPRNKSNASKSSTNTGNDSEDNKTTPANKNKKSKSSRNRRRNRNRKSKD